MPLDHTDPGWPPDAAVHRIHERFQREVVEKLNLCPFARKSRERERVHRPIFRVGRGDPSPTDCARALLDLVRTDAKVEIVLLTFPVPKTHAWMLPDAFDRFVGDVRDEYKQLEQGPSFYMVGFHPDYEVDPGRMLAPESLVPLLRRTPDPVIQCVHARTLDQVRQEAQDVARDRVTKELRQIDPALAQLFERSVQPDPELSADIARQNFETFAGGRGRGRLEALIADIRRERDLAYGEDVAKTQA